MNDSRPRVVTRLAVFAFTVILGCSALLGQEFKDSPLSEKAPGDPRTKPTVEEWAVNEVKAIRLPVGRDGSFIYIDPLWVHSETHQPVPERNRRAAPGKQLRTVLIIGGTDGSLESSKAALDLYEWLGRGGFSLGIRVACIPHADAPRCLYEGPPENAPPSGNLHTGFPPTGEAYHDPETARHHALWRTIATLTPELVVEILDPTLADRMNLERGEITGKPLHQAVTGLEGAILDRMMGLTNLEEGKAIENSALRNKIHQLLLVAPPTPAKAVMDRRLGRKPSQVVRDLLSEYGKKLPEIHYIPALALAERLRWGVESGDDAQVEAVVKIVSENLRQKPEPDLKNGSHLAGHLVLAKLAQTTHPAVPRELRAEAKRLVLKAAHTGWDAEGNMLPVMPFHNQMSDAVFMAGPLLVEAYHLTGDKNYLEMADRNLRQIQAWCLREDGLYRHSPLDDAAWGRGNGFPALGLAWMLDELPPNDPRYEAWLAMYRQHMAALAAHQNKLGMWHQVIDKLDSYQEYTATCMITWAMSRGVRNGWLEKQEYTPRIERAWQAILRRTGSDGHLIDVCTGTGKQKDLEAYYNRTAILGRDDRGGAMGLLFAVEMAAWPEPLPKK